MSNYNERMRDINRYSARSDKLFWSLMILSVSAGLFWAWTCTWH